VVLLTFGRRLGNPLAGGSGHCGGRCLRGHHHHFAGLLGRPSNAREFTQSYFSWIPVGGLQVKWAVLVDPLSIFMCLFVTGVSMLIHLYSIGYMHEDRTTRSSSSI